MFRLQKTSKAKLILPIAGIIISGVIIFFLVKSPKKNITLPKDILYLHLIDEVRGDEATSIVNQMHKKSVTPDNAIIGTYQSPNGQATLYLSLYDHSDSAQEQIQKMISLIRNGDSSIFTHFREIQVQNEKVYLCLGLDQAHYFFLMNQELYWLAVDLPIAQSSMNELVRIVKTQTRR